MMKPDLSQCTPGNYPWDTWQTRALEAGISEDLAGLGRAVYREAYQHSWNEELTTECGWDDDGDEMLELAIASPDKADERWTHLLRTDGLRVFDHEPEP